MTTYIILTGIVLIISVLMIISLWRLFERADVPGWNALIPFLNTWRMFEMTYGNGAYMFLCLIPIYGQILAFITLFKFYKTFDAPTAFCIAGVFLPFIFLPIIAFRGDEFAGYDDFNAKPALIGSFITMGVFILLMGGILVLNRKPADKKAKEPSKKQEQEVIDKTYEVKEGQVGDFKIKYPCFGDEAYMSGESLVATGQVVRTTISVTAEEPNIDDEFSGSASSLYDQDDIKAKAQIKKSGKVSSCKAVLYQKVSDQTVIIRIDETVTATTNKKQAEFEWNKALEAYGLEYSWH